MLERSTRASGKARSGSTARDDVLLELWGGVECTVNRVGDAWRDQSVLTGHDGRDDDLACFAALGIRALRYPVLWERVAPDRPDLHDWRWSDARLAEIARLGMRPIVGLLHHGSGPHYTDLTDHAFPTLFATYAAAVAERYPLVEDWTPINEPLTTARFSALYGVWYPHARDEGLFWRALLNQVEATQGAMRAIRRINPAARLIQTEDLAHHYGTAALADAVDHLNERRWMTWDLLTGRVDRHHPLWDHLARHGLGERLRVIAEAPCPPDMLGVNFYPTSERFLDHRVDRYPFAAPATGYHDLCAARVMDPPPSGLEGVLRQLWERYRLPIAVTESHLGCTRDEQLRWLWQAWQTCRRLAGQGVDIRALTSWALLGNVDWNSLLVSDAGHHEPGAFDISAGTPRPTAVARLAQALATGTPPPEALRPILATPGWWQRDVRLEHPRHVWAAAPAVRPAAEVRPLVITGATGTLGQAFAGACRLRGLSYIITDRATLPIEDEACVAAFLDEHQPWAVINAAGWVRVDDAEAAAPACFRANAEGPMVLAAACAARDIHCTIFSSDLVFGGEQDAPYVESDHPDPLGIYGLSKAQAEALSTGRHPATLLIRTAAFFSPHDTHNFARAVEQVLRDGGRFAASADHVVTPTYVPDLVRATLDLVIDGEGGIWHLTNEEALSWHAFAVRIAEAMGLDPRRIDAATPEQLGWRATRPRQAALTSTRGRLLPPLADALARHAAVRRAEAAPAVLQAAAA